MISRARLRGSAGRRSATRPRRKKPQPVSLGGKLRPVENKFSAAHRAKLAERKELLSKRLDALRIAADFICASMETLRLKIREIDEELLQ